MIVQLVGSSPEQGFGVDVDIAERRGDDGARRDFEVLALEADPDGSQVSATYHLDRFQKRDCVTPGAGPCPDRHLDQWQREDKGGNEKAHEHAENSRTSHKQNTGHGGRD